MALAWTKSSSTGAALPATESEDVETARLRERYGSHMDVVRLIFKAWRMYSLLYAIFRGN